MIRGEHNRGLLCAASAFLALMWLAIPVKAQEQTVYTVKELRTGAMASAIDHEGNVWFGTREGVLVWRKQSQSWQKYTTKDGLSDNYVTSVAVGAGNVVWFGTKHGLAEFDGSSWTTYSASGTNYGLAANHINTVVVDKQNNVWCGTENAGVSMYDGKKWRNFTSEDGLTDNSVRAMVIDSKDNLWFGTRKGLSRYDGKEWVTYTLKESLSVDNMIFSIVSKDDYLLFGTGGGVSKLDIETQEWTRFDKLEGVTVISIAVKGQDIWFGTSGKGIYQYVFKDNKWENYTKEDGLGNNVVTSVSIANPDKKVWFGTYTGGIGYLEKNDSS